jgi:4-amino-4-deoxy-L-arabinose transferase-like glycosyltransferase
MAIDSKGSPNKIEVRYELPPTPFQTLILSYISKVAGAFAAPFVVILFLSVKESVRPKTRRIALWVFGMIQVAVILWLAYTAWSTRNQLATNAVADWTIVALTAVASAVPLWIKREQPAQQLPVKP